MIECHIQAATLYMLEKRLENACFLVGITHTFLKSIMHIARISSIKCLHDLTQSSLSYLSIEFFLHKMSVMRPHNVESKKVVMNGKFVVRKRNNETH